MVFSTSVYEEKYSNNKKEVETNTYVCVEVHTYILLNLVLDNYKTKRKAAAPTTQSAQKKSNAYSINVCLYVLEI